MTGRRDFTELGRERVHEGAVVDLEQARFRFADGEERDYEVVRHKGGGVAVLAHDAEHVFLVRQPRVAVGEADYLELPAGRLDVPGEPVVDAARRELAEELGLGAEHWEHLTTFWLTPDVLDLRVHLYLATGLREEEREAEEDERIEVVRWPLARLDEAIATIPDAKTLVGLLLLKDRLPA